MSSFRGDREMTQDELFTDAASLRAKVLELQKLQANYESMVEAFDGLIYVCSPDRRVEFMNRRLIERTGRNAVGEHCYRAIHEIESVCSWCLNESFFQSETVHREILSPKDQRWYYIVETPMRHLDGSSSKIVMMQDVTERRLPEERLRLLDFALAHVREAVFLIDENAQFRFVNEESCHVLGYTRDELLGLAVSDVDPDFPVDRWVSHWHELKTKGSLVFEGRHRTKEGRILPVEINANYFEYGGHGYNLALVRDITKRKQEENVRLARLRLMEFADSHTLEELLQATLDEAEALTGSLIGFCHFVDADQRTLWLQSWSTRTLREMCTAEGKGLHYNINEAGVWVDCVYERKPVIHNDYSALPHRRGMPIGHAKVTREMVVPVFRSDRIVAILGVGNKPVDYVQSDVEIVSLLADLAWDIADRKLVYENLHRSEAKFLDLYENAPCAYLSVGTDAIIRLCNRRAGELLGYSREELIGKPVLELYADQPEGKEKAGKVLKRFLAGETIADEELLMRKADGSPVWISLTVNGIRDSHGHLVGSRSMVLDISDRKRTEEAQRRLTRELRAISECNQTLLRADDEQTLLNEICRIICDEAGYRLAWVGHAENDDAKTIRPVAWAGFDSGYIADAKLSWAEDTDRGRGPAGAAIRSGEIVYVQDFTTEPLIAPWRESALQRGYRSSIALPLKDECAKVFGVLLIYHSESHAMTPQEIHLMEQLAGDLAFGIVALRTRIERNRTQLELRQSNDLLRTIIETAPTAIIGLDLDGNVCTVWNRAAEKMLGWSADEVMGRPLPSVPEAAREEFRGFRDQILSGKTLEGVEARRQRRNGAPIDYSIYASPLHDANGQITGNIAVMVDISERKRSEEHLRRLFTAVENAGEAIVVTDSEAAIVYVNPAFVQTTGYSSEEALGNNPRILKSGKHDSAFYREMWDTLLNGQVWRGRLINRKKDGTLYEETATISPIKDESGRIVNYVAVKRDVTGEALLQKQLLFAQKMEAIGTLAGGIAHDFNNLLQVILGYSDLLLMRKESGDRGRKKLEVIQQTARDGAELVGRILTFSRKAEWKVRPTDLNQEIVKAEPLLRRTLPRMIGIKLVLASHLWIVDADPAQIEQVLLNLAVNAQHAMPDGGQLLIETRNMSLSDEYIRTQMGGKVGKHVLLTLSDTGVGMKPEVMDRIFEPFFTTKANGEGTGLGLAMVHGIVTQHGGHIRCYSELGAGTSFKIYLPVSASELVSDFGLSREMPEFGTETILLVDDDDVVEAMAREMIEMGGYKVLTARSGEEALETYNAFRDEIALVIMDLIMPGMGGKKCLEKLTKIDPNVKVLVASGYPSDRISRDLEGSRAKGFISKPYDARDVLTAIRQILDRGHL